MAQLLCGITNFQNDLVSKLPLLTLVLVSAVDHIEILLDPPVTPH